MVSEDGKETCARICANVSVCLRETLCGRLGNEAAVGILGTLSEITKEIVQICKQFTEEVTEIVNIYQPFFSEQAKLLNQVIHR